MYNVENSELKNLKGRNDKIEMKRNIGLDILRTIAMIMIVSLHVLGKGKFVSDVYNVEFYRIALILETLSIVAVNCYVLITGYFQIDSKFRIKKVIDIWIKVVFYSISIYIILLLFGQVKFSITDCIKSFFPILTNRYWFVNCYLLLYILSPFINKFISNLEKRDYQKLLMILCIAFCLLTSILPSDFTFDKTGGYGIIWFIILYFIGAYIKRFVICDYKNRVNLYFYFGISMITYVAYLIIRYVCNLLSIQDMASRLYNYNFVTIFISSVFLFLYFKNIKIRNSKIINVVSKIAPLTFTVYIIHEQTVLREILYLDILNLEQLWNNVTQLVIIPFIIIGIFLICILVERVTQSTIQKWIYNILEKFYLRLKNNICYQKIQYKLLQKYQVNKK